ncbi:hypothetical protein [Vallitalea okinawensis]|uniref:hypothetical protein n=1 Tax=Vallitalea okinawensis TaxID=2078660 RepID=UPI000CFAAC83|nr:hypothetical protein [Vallitalea okinawensis]
MAEKHEIGLLIDREYEEVTVAYHQEILTYQQALHTYTETLDRTIDTSTLEANEVLIDDVIL